MTDINKLKLALGGDPARKNQFRVIINPPAILGISLPEVDRLSIVAKSVTDPEDSIGTIIKYKSGKPVPFRGDREFNPITIDYSYDANLLVHDVLYNWMELLVSHEGITASRDHEDYTGSIIIEKLRLRDNYSGDTTPEVIKRCFIKEAFPTNVPSMGFDDDASNESVIVSSTFTYTSFRWER